MRNNLRSIRIPFRYNAISSFWFVLLISCAVLCQTIRSQSIQSQTASDQEKPMKHYAMIFYPTRTLTPEELQQREVEIAAWAKQITGMGITLDPRSFGETAANLSSQRGEVVSNKGSSGSTFSNIVFFDSPSRDQAINIARMHPGLHYGAAVEVREWTSPLGTAAKR
jgi:hypothetical protein